MNSLTKLKMINGTESKQSFAIFASVPGFEIGIRPLVIPSQVSTYMGFRIRAVPIIEQLDGDNKIIKFTTGEAIANAFPGFEFTKKDSTRCSVVWGTMIPPLEQMIAGSPGLFSQALKDNFIPIVLTVIQDKLGAVLIANKNELSAFLLTEYMNKISQIYGTKFLDGDSPEEQIKEVPKLTDGSNILKFEKKIDDS